MRSKLLVSTATVAILGGFVFASAQDMPRGGQQDSGVSQTQGSQSGARRSESQPREESQGKQGKQAQPKPDENRNQQQSTGQGQQSGQGKAKQAQPKPDENRNQQQTDQGQRDKSKAKQAQPKPDQNQQQTDQGQRDKSKAKQAQPKPDTNRNQQQTDQGQRDQAVGQGQQQPRQQEGRQGNESIGQGRVDLSVEQRTRIRQSVFARSDVPRVNNVNFSVSVGTVVPTRVRVVAVPAAIIEIRPEFRNHQYFVVRDEIIIVDNRRRIVAVIPVDSARGGGSAVSGGVDFADLSPEEIRQVQLVLIERGFSLEADGRLGPRTRDALIQFQRREGLQATGQIDSRTVTSLGVSIRSNEQPSTTSQGDRSQPSPRGSGDAQSNSPQNQTSPMGQGNRPGTSETGSETSNQPKTPSPTTGQGQDTPSNPAQRERTGTGNPSTQPGSPSGHSPSGSSPSGGSSGGGQ